MLNINDDDLSEFDEDSVAGGEMEEGKRFHTSSRTNAFNEVLTMLNGVNVGERNAAEVLEDLRGKVQALIGTPFVKDEGEKRHYTPKGLKLHRGHYYGEDSEGKMVYVHLVNGGNIEEQKEKFAHFYGPWRTLDGAKYRLDHNDLQSEQRF